MSDDLVKRLRYGLIEYPKRWSGDTHSDMGGSVDYDKTYALLDEAANRIEELEANLAKAVKLIELAIELGRWELNPSFRNKMIDFTEELTGGKDD